jgi:hypothetical protein
MYKLFDASPEGIFAFYRWQRLIYLLSCATSRVIDEIAKIILFLQFYLPVYVCHSEGFLLLRDLIVEPRRK